MSGHPKKKFKRFRKRTFDPEGLNLKIPPMLLNRLNRLVATGCFGSNVEEAAERMIAYGVMEHERMYSFNDLIDTRGHPDPVQLYPNPEEVETKVNYHARRRELLDKHDELEQRRQEWAKDEDITQEQYEELTDEILDLREQLNLPDPDWLEETPEETEEESDEADQS